MKYIHIDTLNMFFRSIHTVNPNSGVDMMAGMALNTIFSSVRKVWRMFEADHAVFHTEGRSWRKDFYPKYKLNRKVAQLGKTEKERETDEILFEALGDMVTFLKEKTNTTVLRCPTAEADDTIALFIQSHPDDEHIIISTDSDFIQLLKHDNVTIYNGVTDISMTKKGLTDGKGRVLEFTVKSDSKLKVGKPSPLFAPAEYWYEFAMFLKMIRGDKSDNVFSAFPGARLKGSKNKVGITEAYDDRDTMGFNWNNFMLQKWVDEEQQEHVVKDKYEENKKLIDLEQQPDEVRKACIDIINEQTQAQRVQQVGIHFIRFAGQWDLKRLGDSATEFANILNAGYTPK
jgi:5'-3' exonuclease